MVNGDRSEMWKINKKFIDNNRNKKFYFSHNPWNAPTGTFRLEEAEYLIDIGAKDFKQIGENLWEVIW